MITLDFETDVATGEPIVLTWRAQGQPIQVATGADMCAVAALACREGFFAHNATFDAQCIARLIGAAPVWEAYEQGRVLCTMRGAQLRDVRIDGDMHPRGYPLDLVAERLGVPCAPDKANPWRWRYGELRDVPLTSWPREALAYLHDDVTACELIAEIVRDERDLARQSAHAWWTDPMGRTGVRVDAARAAALADRVHLECAEARALCGPIFRPDGTRDMKALAHAAELAGITARTATGRIQVTQETIEHVRDPVLAAYARFLTADAHRSRLLPQLLRGRVTSRYHLAATGREIASGAKERDVAGKQITVGTNVQNLPRKGGWRECIVPDDDAHAFVVADITGLELATFAEILDSRYGSSALAEALRLGLDGHVTMGARLARCSRDAFVRAYRGDLGADARAFAEATRQRAKGPNFGLPGGLGPGGLVRYLAGMGQDVTIEEATHLRAVWLDSDPTYARYLEDAAVSSRMGDPIIAYRSGRVRASTRYTEHANTPFQALGADVAKAAGFRIARECAADTGPLAGFRPAIFAHDEYVISGPRGRAAEAAERVGEIIREVGAQWLAHVPLAGEPLICDRWSKKAKPTRRNGRLVMTEVG